MIILEILGFIAVFAVVVFAVGYFKAIKEAPIVIEPVKVATKKVVKKQPTKATKPVDKKTTKKTVKKTTKK